MNFRKSSKYHVVTTCSFVFIAFNQPRFRTEADEMIDFAFCIISPAQLSVWRSFFSSLGWRFSVGVNDELSVLTDLIIRSKSASFCLNRTMSVMVEHGRWRRKFRAKPSDFDKFIQFTSLLKDSWMVSRSAVMSFICSVAGNLLWRVSIDTSIILSIISVQVSILLSAVNLGQGSGLISRKSAIETLRMPFFVFVVILNSNFGFSRKLYTFSNDLLSG